MRSLRDYLFYVFVRCAWWVGGRIPLRTLRGLLVAISSIGYRLDVRHTERVRVNLRMAFPEWPESRVDCYARKAIAYWGRLAAEIIHARELAPDDQSGDFEVLGARVDAALSRGKGLLILTAHFGNFELLGRVCACRGVPLATFVRPFRNRFFDRFFVKDRRSMNLGMLGRGSGVREALRMLNHGGMVAVLLDQNQRPGRGIFVDMFGRPACTSTVLARLSLATGAPVLPVFAVWRGDRTVPLIGELIEPAGPGSPAEGRTERGQKVRALTARYTAEIETVVRHHPEQWNWVHRRWKTQPSDRPIGPAGGVGAGSAPRPIAAA